MANNKYQKKKIQDTENSGFGKYDEGVGGGASPNDSKQGTHGHGANSDYRKENNDTMQARTADGKFTYKSVNGQSIDPKYGPSRGKTVNPLLTGGKNGIKIDDVESQFSAQKGDYWDKYKDSWYTKGGEMALKSGKTFSTRVAGKSIWDLAKEIYNEVTGEFGGNIDVSHGNKRLQGYGGKEESNIFDEAKKGRHSLDEKAALQKAKKSKSEQAVIDSDTGGIKLKGGQPVPKSAPAPQQAAPTAPTPVAPRAPAQQPQPQAQPQQQAAPISASANNMSPANSAALNKLFGGNTPADVEEEKVELQEDFSSDASLAKSNPSQFANKYQNEIKEMMGIIKSKKPNFTTNQLISLIANGKLKNIGQVRQLFGQ